MDFIFLPFLILLNSGTYEKEKKIIYQLVCSCKNGCVRRRTGNEGQKQEVPCTGLKTHEPMAFKAEVQGKIYSVLLVRWHNYFCGDL